jgi:hypothetical protein
MFFTKSKLLLSAVIAALLIFSCSIPMGDTATSTWEYPVQAGTDEWAKLETHIDQINACQIPEDVCATMPTDQLIETVLDYPLLIDIYAYDTFEAGITAVSAYCNALDALLKRPDAAEKLGSMYAERALSKSVDDFKSASMQILAGHMQLKQEKTSRAASTTVSTPNGTSVVVLILGEQLSSSRIKEIDAQIASTYPNAKRLRSATTNYNCHSYAWYNQSASNKYWMNDPSAYWTDGSYTSNTTGNVNDRVYYVSNHSAIITTRTSGPIAPGNYGNIIVTSKWGSCGLYTHSAQYGPYYTSNFQLNFYSRPQTVPVSISGPTTLTGSISPVWTVIIPSDIQGYSIDCTVQRGSEPPFSWQTTNPVISFSPGSPGQTLRISVTVTAPGYSPGTATLYCLNAYGR